MDLFCLPTQNFIEISVQAATAAVADPSPPCGLSAVADFLPSLAQDSAFFAKTTSGLVIFLLTAAVTWAVTAFVMGQKSKEATKFFTASLDQITEKFDKLDGKLDQFAAARSACELRAARNFATQESFIQVVADQTVGFRNLSEKIDKINETSRASVGKVHNRVDSLDSRVTHIEAITGVKKS